MQKELTKYIYSNFPFIAVNTLETERAVKEITNIINYISEDIKNTNASPILKENGYKIQYWDCLQQNNNPNHVFALLLKEINPTIVIAQNHNLFWNDTLEKSSIIQHCLNIVGQKLMYKHIIFVGNIHNIPDEITHLFSWLDFSLPSRDEVKKLVVEEYASFNKKKLTTKEVDKISDASAGMTMYEIECAIKSSMVKNKGLRIEPLDILEEKAKSVRKSGLLEYVKVEDTIENVGGLVLLKDWIKKIAYIFNNLDEAKKYNLPIPKGSLITGISGTGKSLITKVMANEFNIPLYRLDIGRLYGGLVGDTEKNTRELFRLIDSVSPAVIHIDEIEKAMAGLESSGHTDSGVTSRLLGSFLTYFQEKTSPSFFAATANSVDNLPPELLRRFNGIWFVDLPEVSEREDIFKIHLAKVNRDISDYDIKELRKQTEGFTGAEIENVIYEAMYSAFAEDREFVTKDIITAIKNTPLIIKTKEKEIMKMRMWAKGRARIANVVSPKWWDNIENEYPKIISPQPKSMQ